MRRISEEEIREDSALVKQIRENGNYFEAFQTVASYLGMIEDDLNGYSDKDVMLMIMPCGYRDYLEKACQRAIDALCEIKSAIVSGKKVPEVNIAQWLDLPE